MPFAEVHGHHRLVELLKRSIARGTLPPSLLFVGPAGVGKRLTAVAVAQALNCLEPSDDACGECAACRRIARGIHPDVLLVQPGDSGAIKIDQVREIIERAAYRPFEGRRRVVIVDDADALVAAAQNALLKTLEEPPPSSIFILVTARPDVLLATVRSRCPQLRFRPLSADDLAAALVAHGETESEARAVAATADGSIGQALQARAGDVVEARGVAERVLTETAAQAAPARRLAAAQTLLAGTGGTAASDRERLASHLRAMGSLLRDAEVMATSADERLIANTDLRPAVERLAGAYRGERGVRAYAAIDQALVAIERNAGVKLVADWLVLQL